MKLAGAPISWGVCEVPGWGLQLSPGRVLGDMEALGMTATEAGPPGFLPAKPAAALSLLRGHGLRLVGGFVNAVLHDEAARPQQLAQVERSAWSLSELGAEQLILAPSLATAGYSGGAEIDDASWAVLFRGLDDVSRLAARHGLAMSVHPHWGTVIERAHHVDRFLAECAHPLCLDTGHLALGGSDPTDVARRAGDRVRHVHLKDVDAELARCVRDGALDYATAVRRGLYRALGDGSAGIAATVGLLHQRGFAGWYVLEQDVMLDSAPEGPPAGVRRSAEFAVAHA